jgi:CHAD domain-containing protein
MDAGIESGQFAGGAVSRLLERLAYRVNAALHNHGEEPIHELRVAIRRFNQSLALFKDLYRGKDRKKIRRRLKSLLDLTSDIRDCDIAFELLPKSELPGAAELNKPLAARRKEALRMLLPALRAWTAGRTTSKWRAALTPNGASQTPLAEMVHDRLPRIAERFFDQAENASSATRLHLARVQGKKLRYSLELLQPVYGAQAQAVVEQLKAVQTLLGNAHDAHAVRLLAADLGGDDDLAAWLKKRERKKTREFHDAWAKIERPLRDAIRDLDRPARRPVARSAAQKTVRMKTA